MAKKITNEEFIEKSKILHKDKYNYSLTEYVGNKIKVKILCKEHGIFEQRPNDHLTGYGCPLCGRQRIREALLSNVTKFIEKSKKFHGNKFDYSLVKYVDSKTKVNIVCRLHGVFLRMPGDHIQGVGCPKCANKNVTTDDFVEKASKAHNNLYDYSKVKYINNTSKIKIICKKHGLFKQQSDIHLQGGGCQKCASDIKKIKLQNTLEDFIKKARKIHGDKYDYSEVDYKNIKTKVKIICPKHGEFKKLPKEHIVYKRGCAKCTHIVSNHEIDWLNYLGVPNTPKHRQVVLKIKKQKFKIDGYNPETNTIYEFWGDYWHGNPAKYNPNKINKQAKKTFGELYQKTLDKKQAILNAGYNLVEIWESDWIKIKKGG